MNSRLKIMRAYAGAINRTLASNPFLISNRSRISSECVVSGSLFEFVFAKLILEGDCTQFLQIGANTGQGAHDYHGLLTKHRVPSLLIEPQPDVFEKLKANYKSVESVRVVNAAIDRRSGFREIYRLTEVSNRYHLRGGRFGTGIASFDKKHVWNYFVMNATETGRKQDPAKIIEAISIPCLTFAELRARFGLECVDVLMIDTEGYDYEILKMVQIDTLRPKLIKYEYKHLGTEMTNSWKFLTDLGYRLVNHRKTGDTIAVHDSVLDGN